MKDISILSAADQIIINDDMILFQLSSGYINRIKNKKKVKSSDILSWDNLKEWEELLTIKALSLKQHIWPIFYSRQAGGPYQGKSNMQ